MSMLVTIRGIRNNNTLKETSMTTLIEHLDGNNMSRLRHHMGRIHVSLTLDEALEEMKAQVNWDDMPGPLQRGFTLAVKQVHQENRDLYASVACGRFTIDPQ